MTLVPRHPTQRGCPPLRQPNRRTGALLPADHSDEPAAPVRLALHSSGAQGPGLRQQGDAALERDPGAGEGLTRLSVGPDEGKVGGLATIDVSKSQ